MEHQSFSPIRAVSTVHHLHPKVASPYQEFESNEGYEESSLYDYWRVLYKFRILIAACVLLSTLGAVLYAFLVTPLYTATSTIRIGTYEPILPSTSVEGIYQEQSKEANYLATQVQEITSFTVGDRVLRDPKIRSALEQQTPRRGSFWKTLFGSEERDQRLRSGLDDELIYEHPVPLIRDYLTFVAVNPVRRTSLVEISATSPDPGLSARVANAHAREYREWVRESRVRQRSDTLQFLREQANELRQKVTGLERELADYAEQHSIVAVNKDENITAQRMSQLSKLLTEVTAQRIEAENRAEKAADVITDNSAAYDDATTLEMRAELGKLKGEYGMLIEKFTPEYPRVKQLKARIEQIEAGIIEQREQIVSGLRSKVIALRLEEERLHEELEQQKSRTFELAKKQVEYNVLARELESSRELLQNVLRQSKESALAIEGNSSNISLVDPAVAPESASSPKKGLIILAGLGVGLGLGLALAFLLNHLDNTIRTPEVLAQVTMLPNLGMVPAFEETALGAPQQLLPGAEKARAADSHRPGECPPGGDGSLAPLVPVKVPQPITFLRDPRSLASEAYRTIRTGILLSQAGRPPRTILLTSAQSSEGKTTSAINLAASLSSSGGRVVIVDCDLRRPSLLRYFDIDQNLPGIVEVITGAIDLESVKIENLIKRITVIPSGRIPPNPAELIGSAEMKRLVQTLGEQYDFVVLDSPPVLPVTDSVVLSQYVEGVVLVVKGGATPRRVVRDATDRLRNVGGNLLGTILNDVDFQGADYYYYNRYYSSYYQQPEAAQGQRASA